MRCRTARRLAAELAEGVGGTPWQADLSDHLRSCPGCACLTEELARSWQALLAYPAIEPSKEFVPRLRARLELDEPRTSPEPFRPAGWQWMAVVATALVAILVGPSGLDQPRAVTESGLSRRDLADDRFLADLQTTLDHFDSTYFPVHSSWPDSLLDPTSQEFPPSP